MFDTTGVALNDLRNPIQKIADFLHEKSCPREHDWECGYNLESWDSPKMSVSKQDYYNRAKDLILRLHGDNELAREVIVAIFPA